MRCEESRQLIDFYLDGELDALRAAEFELHVRGCGECTPQIERASKLRSAIREAAPYFAAPPALKSRIREALRAEAGAADSSRHEPSAGQRASEPRTIRSWWGWTAGAVASVAAAIILVATLSGRFGWQSEQEEIADEVAASHLRSLMANHLTDVTSSDRHTVKPWFDGKIDFAPNVPDFAADGFPLAGGRLDYINHRAVAALVYQRRLHTINVFIWPTNSPASTQPKLETREGYNLLHWQKAGMEYWAASDVNADDLKQLAQLLEQ